MPRPEMLLNQLRKEFASELAAYHRLQRNFIASYALRMLSFLLLFWSLLAREWNWTFACLIIIFVSLVPTVLEWDYKITLPWQIDLLLASAVALHFIGGALHAYHHIPGYDTITHFVSSLFIAFLAFSITFVLDAYWDGLNMNTYAMAFVVVTITMSMGVVWEFLEWGIDMFLGTSLQWGLEDTMKDLLVDTLAGLFMATVGVWLVKKGELGKITYEFGEDFNRFLAQYRAARKR